MLDGPSVRQMWPFLSPLWSSTSVRFDNYYTNAILELIGNTSLAD